MNQRIRKYENKFDFKTLHDSVIYTHSNNTCDEKTFLLQTFNRISNVKNLVFPFQSTQLFQLALARFARWYVACLTTELKIRVGHHFYSIKWLRHQSVYSLCVYIVYVHINISFGWWWCAFVLTFHASFCVARVAWLCLCARSNVECSHLRFHFVF